MIIIEEVLAELVEVIHRISDRVLKVVQIDFSRTRLIWAIRSLSLIKKIFFEKLIQRFADFSIASVTFNLVVYILSITTCCALESWIIFTNNATAERNLASGGPTKQRLRRIAVDDRDRRRSAPLARWIVGLLFTIANLTHQYPES